MYLDAEANVLDAASSHHPADDLFHPAALVNSEPGVDLSLHVRDPEVATEILARAAGRDRDEFALGALRIGVFSLRQARGVIDSGTVHDEMERMMSALRAALDDHQNSLASRTEGALRQYFDPSTGCFVERVERLTKDDGELVGVLRRHLDAEDSVLARTLAAHLGPDSAILRMIDPTNAAGLLANVQALVKAALDVQRDRILAEFSLDQEGSALRRMVAEISETNGQLSDAMRTRIDDVVKQFSLDEPDSALTRLVRHVELAQKQITSEFTLDSDSSALGRLAKMLTDFREKVDTRLAQLGTDLRGEISALATRRKADSQSPAHGHEFQAGLMAFLEQRAAATGDVFSVTGNTTGLIKFCKTGDGVLQLSPEHAAANARIVVEAKEDASYTVAKALEEIEQARKNRGACVGLFIFSRESAPETLPAVARYGSDIIAVWDANDLASDLALEVAVSLAKALCVQGKIEEHDDVDLEAMDRAIRDVEKQIGGLTEIQTSAQSIERGSQNIQAKVRTMTANLGRAVKDLDVCAAGVKRSLGRE